ncbi:MAG: DUF3552 domain-containing protein [Deltaproteobacteria bacterium]|nr:DUF3552 domain-containing protein [Deltaproteobacteria bacterium]
MNTLETILLGVLSAGMVSIVVYYALKIWKLSRSSQNTQAACAKAEEIIKNCDLIAYKLTEQAKVKAQREIQKTREKCEQDLREQEKELKENEVVLEERQKNVETRFQYIESRYAEIIEREGVLKEKQGRLEELKNQFQDLRLNMVKQLENKSSLSSEEAKHAYIKSVIDETRHEEAKALKLLETEWQSRAERFSKRLISVALNRYSGSPILPKPMYTIPVTSSKMKGRIIGKSGRNIKEFQERSGVTLEFDDEARTVSIIHTDSFKKEIARQALLKLLDEERFNPHNVVRYLTDTENQLKCKAVEDGKKAFKILNMGRASQEIYEVSGRLKYRYSYNQNIYYHSIEMAFLGGCLAAELKENIIDARRASFLHDIGKVLMDPGEGMGGHAVIGAEYAMKYGEKEHIAYAMGAHHDEYKPKTPLDDIVKAADALSGGRPGARIEAVESYSERIEQLTHIATSYPGVTHCYAMHAGRELRVFVDSETVGDNETREIAKKIAAQVEKEVIYPGQVQVIVIRENRATGTAY